MRPSHRLGGLTIGLSCSSGLTGPAVVVALHLSPNRQIGQHQHQLFVREITRQLMRETAELVTQVVEGEQIGPRPQGAFPASTASASKRAEFISWNADAIAAKSSIDNMLTNWTASSKERSNG